SPGRQPWVRRRNLRKSPGGATQASNRDRLCRLSGAKSERCCVVPGLTPWATLCRPYRGSKARMHPEATATRKKGRRNGEKRDTVNCFRKATRGSPTSHLKLPVEPVPRPVQVPQVVLGPRCWRRGARRDVCDSLAIDECLARVKEDEPVVVL